MTQIRSQIDPRSEGFRRNHERMAERLAQVQALQGQVVAESASKQDKFEKKGQLLPRERVARLLDRGSSFLELSALAGLGMHDDDGKKSVLGGGSIVGIGQVAGKRVLISASDSAVKGGTVAPMGLKKGLRAQAIALQNKLPLIALVESGGANLLYQSEIFVDGGRSFANQARLSAAGIPQIAIVHGSSTAGGAYLPGLSDYVVLVRGRSKIFLAGPPLVKAAIGEDADDEELGGADLHGRVTGLGEYVAEDDAQALAYGREIMRFMTWDQAGEDGATKDNVRRATMWKSCWVLYRPMTGRRSTCARSLHGWPTVRIFLNSSATTVRRPCAAMGWWAGIRSASSRTMGRSCRRGRPRRRSSSSCATKRARRLSFCRTPRVTWWASRRKPMARSSTGQK
jgi:hypothetical protein